MRVTVTIPTVGLTDKQRVAVARAYLNGGVVAVNRLLIRWGLVPPLYRSGVLFKPEKPGVESFADALTVYRRGHGDCAHLSAWRVAELQEALYQAKKAGKVRGRVRWPDLRLYMRPRRRMVHVQVRHSDGRIEDPSRFLGMAKE